MKISTKCSYFNVRKLENQEMYLFIYAVPRRCKFCRRLVTIQWNEVRHVERIHSLQNFAIYWNSVYTQTVEKIVRQILTWSNSLSYKKKWLILPLFFFLKCLAIVLLCSAYRIVLLFYLIIDTRIPIKKNWGFDKEETAYKESGF